MKLITTCIHVYLHVERLVDLFDIAHTDALSATTIA